MALDDSKRVFDFGPNAGLGFLQLVRERPWSVLLSSAQRLPRCTSTCQMDIDASHPSTLVSKADAKATQRSPATLGGISDMDWKLHFIRILSV